MEQDTKLSIFFSDSNKVSPILSRGGQKNIYSSACDMQGPYE